VSRALWGQPSPPVAWFSGVVSKSNDYNTLVSFDGYEGEGESMKDELFCSGFCGVMVDWNQWGMGFLKQLNGLSESIDQAFSKPDFF
jgi:hypothetical protein